MKTRAYIKENATSEISFKEIEIQPKDTDLLIRTSHAGLSRGDIFILENKWEDTVYPTVGTAETIGIVEKVGKNTKDFNIGDRVGLGYILGACMACTYCLSGLHHYCSKQINTARGGWGGLSELTAVDYRLAVKMPENLESTNALPLLCYGVTAYSGIKKARLEKGSYVGLIGLGGLGGITVKILKGLDLNVTVFSHGPNKKEIAKQLGADNFILTNNGSSAERFRYQFDLIINSSPSDLDLAAYLDLLKPEGKFCYLGLPFSKQQFAAAQLADYSSRSIYGNYVGSLTEINELLQLVLDKQITLDIITFPITDLEKAVDFVKNDTSHKRVVLSW